MAGTAEQAMARPGGWLERKRADWRTRATARDKGSVLLNQRRVYILPTRAGLGFCVLLLVLLIGSINYNLGLGFGLTFLAGACALVDMVQTTRNLAGLVLSPGRAPDVFAGEDAPFELRVENPTRLARYAVWIDFEHVPEPRQAIDVPAGGSTALVLRTATTTRGWMRPPRVRLSTHFPLGLFRAWSWWQPDSRALVYPFPEQDAPPLPMLGRPSPDGVGSAGSDDFAGVRSYQPGDPQRHLAWRQIARLDPELGGQLVTKHFEGGTVDELVLDFDALPPRLDVELRLARMARWVLEAEQRALPYGFILGRIRYDAALGTAHQAACLRALALYGLPEDPA
ncbi:hypothetical protein IA69_21800 [Massilia sp. JS1662]|nr:hypothetical protein IA69_21800 [Massilia sp. JS1662]